LATSTDTTRIEGGTSQKTGGDVEFSSIETPSASATPAIGRLDEKNTTSSRIANSEAIECERNRLRSLFIVQRVLRCNTQTIVMSLQSSTTVLDYINSDGTAISSEDLKSWIKDSADAIEYAIELDKRKDACTGADATQLHELEDGAKARMETLIDGLASRWPQPEQIPSLTPCEKMSAKVDHLAELTDVSKEQSRRLLVQSSWDVYAAVTAHFDAEEASSAYTSRPSDTPVATTKHNSSGSGAQAPIWSPPTFAGPSGIEKLPKLTKKEEEAELVADRERVARLIRLSDKEYEKEKRHSRSQESKHPNSGPSMTFDPNDTKGTADDNVSTMPVSTRGTWLEDLANIFRSEPTRKRRNSSSDASSGSPDKKRCGMAEDTAATSTEVSQVESTANKWSSDLLQRQSPKVKLTLVSPPSIKPLLREVDWASTGKPASTGNSEFDKATESKLAQLRDMGFSNEERNARVLNECYGDVAVAAQALAERSPVDTWSDGPEGDGEEIQSSNVKAPVSTSRDQGDSLQSLDGSSIAGQGRKFIHSTVGTYESTGKREECQHYGSPKKNSIRNNDTTVFSEHLPKRPHYSHGHHTELATDELHWIHEILQASRSEEGRMDGDAIKVKKSADKGKGKATPRTGALCVLAAFQDVKEDLAREVQRRHSRWDEISG
jgi:hypothetical protein